MKDKDIFKKPKARHTGADLFEQNEQLLGDMKESVEERNQETTKTHSFTILPSYIEKMRNLVHYKRVNGNPYYTQGNLIQEALDIYFEHLGIDIEERPKEVKKAELRRTGRKKKVKVNGPSSTNDLLFEK